MTLFCNFLPVDRDAYLVFGVMETLASLFAVPWHGEVNRAVAVVPL